MVQKMIDAGLPEDVISQLYEDAKNISSMCSSDAARHEGRFDKIISLPWNKRSDLSKITLARAEEILNEDHYGIPHVKNAILESLAVQKRSDKSDILTMCLFGAPGIGKTTLAKSIARATNREFVRISLGGVYHEPTIRGHALCWAGSHPGVIINSLLKAGVKNPLILLDEIDKIGGSNGHGSSSGAGSALLEVLDPSQNNKFRDHYIDADFDLSEIMFLATANTLDIAPPLKDRMEIIHMTGYTDEEKFHITKNNIIPKQYKTMGVDKKHLEFPDKTLERLIRDYSLESGIRELERCISKIFRKVALKIEKEENFKKKRIGVSQLVDYLGNPIASENKISAMNEVGEVTGLTCTPMGGAMLTVESCKHEGNGRVHLTGNLGNNFEKYMKAAVLLVHSELKKINLTSEAWKKHDIHVNADIPNENLRDEASVGITVVTSLFSILANKRTKPFFAMTGEISLNGKILSVDGVREKIIAAARHGVKEVLIPHANKNIISDLPDGLKKRIKIHTVKNVSEAFKLLFD